MSSATWSCGPPHHPDSTRGVHRVPRRRGVVMSSIRTTEPHRLTINSGVGVDCGPGLAEHSPLVSSIELQGSRCQLGPSAAGRCTLLPREGAQPTAHRSRQSRRGAQRDALAARGWVKGYARLDDPGHHLSAPHIEQPSNLTTPARSLTASLTCGLGEAQSSIARGARLTAANCFHTLVSPIRRAARLRHGTVRVANRMAVRNQVGDRGPGCSGGCAGC